VLEKTSWPYLLKTEDVLHGVKEERNIVRVIIREKDN
jgi:hypothetical protein